MNGFMGLIVLGTSIWMAVDASRLGYDKRDVRGLAAMGPAGWFFAGVLLWIVAFPLYLAKRGELREAAEHRRRLLAAGYAPGQITGHMHGAMPAPGYGSYGGGNPHAAGPYGPGGYGPGPYGAGAYGPGHYGSAPHGGPAAAPTYGPAPYAPGPYGPAPTYAGPPTGTADRDVILAEIVKLDQLRVAGLLTDDEFQHKKSELLART